MSQAVIFASILILSSSANAESNIALKIENNPTELKFQDGSKYSGNTTKCTIKSTIKNCMQGKGIYTTSSGYRYTGSFINNKPEGYGELISPTGQVYKGEFKSGSLEGEGEMLYPDGRRYIGSFKENNREGQGTMSYPAGEQYGEGSQYNGYWKLNKRNGRGKIIYFDDGRILKGEFKENILVKRY